MIRAIVIEDHIIIGVGLRNMFYPSRDGIEITELFHSVQDTIIKAKSQFFDIIILDLWIGKTNPQNNYKNLSDQFPEKPILIFTGEESLEWRRKMIQIGVKGYISKSSTKPEIKKAIQGIFYDGKYFPSTIKKQTDECLNEPDPIDFSIVLLLSEGYTLRKIASKKMLSISTIEKNLIRQRLKYNASNNIELIKLFIGKNMLS